MAQMEFIDTTAERRDDGIPAPRTSRGGWLLRPVAVDTASALLRVWLGTMGMVHGYGKVFGGIGKFTGGVASMGFPAPELFAWAAALSEFAGGALLVLGLLTRPSALFMALTMAVAGFIRHADDPFKVKELALTYLVLSIVVLLTGPGRFSLDALLARRRS